MKSAGGVVRRFIPTLELIFCLFVCLLSIFMFGRDRWEGFHAIEPIELSCLNFDLNCGVNDC